MKTDQRKIPGAFDKVLMAPWQVRQARVALGLRQKELAMVLGVRPSTVSRWERRTGVGGPARAMLRLLVQHPGVLFLLGLNYPARVPRPEVEDGGEGATMSEVQDG